MPSHNTQTILIISSELDVSDVVNSITTRHPRKDWSFIYLLEDLKEHAGDDLKREDVFIVRDFALHGDVEKIFREISLTYSVTKVIPNDEFAVYIAAWANYYWQLPGLNFDMATRFRDKKRMKSIAKEAGINTAREITADEIRRGEVTFPVILKPRSLAGSVGVRIIENINQLNEMIISQDDEYRDMDEKQFFIESYNTQPVYQIDVIVLQGRPAFLFVGEYINKPIDYLNEHPLGYFSVTDEDRQKIWCPFIEKVLSAFDGPDGVYHIEAFGDAGAGVELLEIAYRPGGAATVEMINIACGLDLRYIHLAVQLNLNIELYPEHKNEAWGYMVFPKKHLAKKELYVSQVSLPSADNMTTLRLRQLPRKGDIASGEFFCHKDSLGSFVFCGDRESTARDLKRIVTDYQVNLTPS